MDRGERGQMRVDAGSRRSSPPPDTLRIHMVTGMHAKRRARRARHRPYSVPAVALTGVAARDSVTTGHADGEEDAMTLNEQIDALQARAAELKSSFDASRQETSEKIKQRIADVKAKAAAAQTTAHDHVDESVDRAHIQWQTFKADVSAKMRELKERVQRKRDERDAKDAEKSAERAEEYASDSLDFAAWAIAEAEMDVLDAVDARVIANAKAAGSPSS